MNNVDILIVKLGAFPSTDICKFYCPVDQQYYYVKNDGVILQKDHIIVRVSSPNDFSVLTIFNMTYGELISNLSFFGKIARTNQLRIQIKGSDIVRFYCPIDKEYKEFKFL
jgi:hypothetical protein